MRYSQRAVPALYFRKIFPLFEVLTAEQTREADAQTIAGGVPGIALMETAGTAVAAEIVKAFKPCPVLVLCGPGNNGGDGFIAAARLKKDGWDVRVACAVKKNMLKGDAALASRQWTSDTESLNSNLPVHQTALVVDALFGTGFAGALAPETVTLFDKIRSRKITVVAVDVPSGMNATSGDIAPGILKADMTVTFSRKKTCHMLLPSKTWCGKVIVTHIGIADDVIAATGSTVFENAPPLWLKSFSLPDVYANKYDRGHLVVYGGRKRTGAACLAAFAGQRAGAGLVTIMSPPESHAIYSGYRASIMVDAWKDMDAFKAILRDERKNAVIIGPGSGEDVKPMVEAVLGFNKACVFDADVFSAFRDCSGELFAKLSPERHVLTPHEGEFERIFGAMEGSKLERAQKAAKIANAVVVLKGADTVIAAPDGTTIINANAPATLATAGSGDVLAGLIGGFMAQKMPPFMAAAAACWLQGEAAGNYGLGLTAEDIISQIPQALNKLFDLGKIGR